MPALEGRPAFAGEVPPQQLAEYCSHSAVAAQYCSLSSDSQELLASCGLFEVSHSMKTGQLGFGLA
jgi:hypothetical protein